MKKDKPFRPKSYEDLLKLFYGENLDGKNRDLYALKQYNDDLISRFKSPHYEDYVKGFFSNIGEVKKIPKKHNKYTYDFKIESEKILIEVTSINTDIRYEIVKPFNEVKFEDVINVSINHIVIKDSSDYSGYIKGGVIVYDIPAAMRAYPSFHDKTKKLILENIEIKEKDWDYLIFVAQPASIGFKSSLDVYPPLIFIKETALQDRLKLLFPDSKVFFIICNS